MATDLLNKAICSQCVGGKFLRREISEAGHEVICSYCEEPGSGYSLNTLATRINTAFEEHFQMTSDEGDSWEKSGEGEPVVDAIMNAADIPPDAASDIQSILEDRYYDRHKAKVNEATEFSQGTEYAEKDADPYAWHEAWNTFENTLKTQARFFSNSAVELLDSIFASIDTLATAKGQPLVTQIGPDHTLKSIYRARFFETDRELEDCLARPDLRLAGPPPRLALARRMNAAGISVFYGATAPKVALAEIRPPVGSKAAVGCFDFLRNLRLLDLAALGDQIQSPGSIFDPNHLKLLERLTFLRMLSYRMTRPIMPTDEDSEYLPTQAVADYLSSSAINLDGIIFPSAQAAKDGQNVVLFHKTARVEELPIVTGTKIHVSPACSYPDGCESDYYVCDILPSDSVPSTKPDEGRLPTIEFLADIEDTAVETRPTTLRVDSTNLIVHHIKYVDVVTEKFPVSRFSRKDGDCIY